MASIDPSLTSDPGEKKWVHEIKDILIQQLQVDLDIPSVSVFQVPETITTKKPEAYEPQQIGLGPLHHFRPGQYKKMEQKKLNVVRKVLKDYGLKDDVLIVLSKVRKHVPIVRSCYDMFLEDDDDSLAWIFAIDGLFLLNLFQTFYKGMDSEKEEYNNKLKLPEIANDLKLVEKQAYQPKLSIKKILDSPSSSHSYHDVEENTESDDFTVLKSRSEEITNSDIEATSEKQTQSELLGDLPKPLFRKRRKVKRARKCVNIRNLLEVFKFSPSFPPPPPPSQPPPPPPPPEDHIPKIDPKRRLLAQDIMMVENQIPFKVLKEIEEALHQSSGNSSNSSNKFSPSIFRTFCEIHSPLDLCSKTEAPTSAEHLLQYMYSSIVQEEITGDQFDDDYQKAFDPQKSSSQAFNFIKRIPVEEIIEAYKQTILILETFSQSKSLIPSASELRDRVGFIFYPLSIDQIELNWKYISLPCVTLNIDSEVILRNLVAYETLRGDSHKFPITEYVSLMCALIVNVEDVNYLRSCEVIAGDLSSDEVIKLFTSMSSSIPAMKAKEKSKFQDMINKINKEYETVPMIKTHLFLKKLAHNWLLVVLRAIGGFAEASWKIVAFMVSIVTMFMLIWQAYCDIYGCDKMTITLPSYSST